MCSALALACALVFALALAFTIALALGSYQSHSRGASGKLGWRRGKRFDVFRSRAIPATDAVSLGDPNLEAIDLTPLENFLDVGQDTTDDCRHNDAKSVCSGMRGLADNTIDEADEPDASDRKGIPFDEFYTIVRKAFGHASKAHAGASYMAASLL